MLFMVFTVLNFFQQMMLNLVQVHHTCALYFHVFRHFCCNFYACFGFFSLFVQANETFAYI